MGGLFASYGIISFVLIPKALLVDNSGGKAFFWLMIIFFGLVIGLTGIAQLVLPFCAEYIVYMNAHIQRYLCCSTKAKRHMPLVIQNLKEHKKKNHKIGIMIITTVMYMIFVNSFSKQLSGLFFSKIQNYIGGDMAII